MKGDRDRSAIAEKRLAPLRSSPWPSSEASRTKARRNPRRVEGVDPCCLIWLAAAGPMAYLLLTR